MNNNPKHEKTNDELEPGTNTVIEPDKRNPGPTDMIEGVVGDIIDNIRKDFTHKSDDHSSDQNVTDKSDQ
ncbi:hypothetical protein PAECIP112173_00874 [Paenibacillus sp. JJ-100]|uniref:hypothetical protein n=1 Tax=Paenibacillus sp. JJ-100 TaxID=2974896 RepID=UPI0022FFBB36|nr:hypothetical protein [Paenibacillus sp. JJ-100]CAI6037435.1 hypothetical protein PAECIP112173_00874 [Paenibacillus sp. JJ-100]